MKKERNAHVERKVGESCQWKSRSPKNLENWPLASFFFDDRAADGRKHSTKMRVLEISKKYEFWRSALFLWLEANS